MSKGKFWLSLSKLRAFWVEISTHTHPPFNCKSFLICGNEMETDAKTAPPLDLLVLTLLGRKRAKKFWIKVAIETAYWAVAQLKKMTIKSTHTHTLAKHSNLLGPKASEILIKNFKQISRLIIKSG